MNTIRVSILNNLIFLVVTIVITILSFYSELAFNCAKILILLWLGYIFVKSYKRNGFFSVYTIFVGLLAFFIYDSFLFDLFNYGEYDNFLTTFFPCNYTFKKEYGIYFIQYTAVFFFFLDCTYSILVKKRKKNVELIQHKNGEEKFLQSVCICLIIISSPIIIYRLFNITSYAVASGYIEIVKNGVPDSIIPGWTNGFMGIFYVSFLVLLINPPSKRLMLLVIVLYMINCFIKGVGGNRGAFLYEFIALIVTYCSLYKTKHVKNRSVVLLAVFCIVFSIIIGNSRENNNNYRILDFFAVHTVSKSVPLSIIEGNIPYHTYPFIFSPLYNFGTPQSDDIENRIKKDNSINLLTTYKLSEWHTRNGHGMGGSVLAEFIDCGKLLGVILWTILLSILIHFTDSIRHTKGYLRPLAYIIMVNMFHNPRGYFFSFIVEFKYYITALLIYVIINAFYELLIYKRVEYV